MPPSVPMPDTLVGVDALIRLELEGFVSHWFWTLLGFTFLVAIGLVWEGPEIWHDTVGALKEICRRPAIKRKLSPWAKLAGTFGWVLIIAGVVGEGIAEGFLFKADGVVLKFDEILLTDAQRQATLARERAGGAYERAATAEKEAAQLRKDAEAERLERLRLQAIVVPRSIDLDQQRRIADPCNIFKGHNALVASYGLDTEAFAFGEQIISVLRAMRITVADARASAVVTGPMESGIHVRTNIIQESSFASCIAEALSKVGNLQTALNDNPPPFTGSAMGGSGQSFKPNIPFVSIFIGAKPLPLLTNRHNRNTTK